MPTTFIEVANRAEEMFEGFRQSTVGGKNIETYLAVTNTKTGSALPDAALIRFLRHVAGQSIAGYQKNALITYSIQPLDGIQDDQGRTVRAPSWLARDNMDPQAPVIRIDSNFINSRFPENAPNRSIVIAKLVLHEIGHVALHWQDLYPKKVGQYNVNSASPEQETQAWWFAGAVWALILGRLAPRGRNDNVIDSAWYRA